MTYCECNPFFLSSILIKYSSLVFSLALGVQKVTFTPDRDATINISSNQVKGCRVCTGARHSHCNTSLLLTDSTRVSLEFECSRPQDVFSVEIVRNIGEMSVV